MIAVVVTLLICVTVVYIVERLPKQISLRIEHVQPAPPAIPELSEAEVAKLRSTTETNIMEAQAAIRAFLEPEEGTNNGR